MSPSNSSFFKASAYNTTFADTENLDQTETLNFENENECCWLLIKLETDQNSGTEARVPAEPH